MYLDQNLVNIYIQERLDRLGITKEEAVRRSGVPEELVDRFLTDLSELELGEKLRVIIMFGSVIGDPVELGPLCGIEFGGEAPAEEIEESDGFRAEDLGFRGVDMDALKQRGFELPTDGSPLDWDALRRALADMGIDWPSRS